VNERERGEIEHDVYISLRDHFNALRQEQDRRIEQALTAAKDAVDKAEKAQERRLDLLNEFRAQAADEARKYALRETVEQTFRERDSRLGKTETQIARLYGGLAVVAFVGLANVIKLWTG
jgi:hypothetical protein